MRSFKEQYTSNTSISLPGMLVTSRSYKGSVWKPKWDDNVRLETHFRAVGPLTGDLKGFMPWRMNPEPNEFGSWLASVPIFVGGTSKMITCIPLFADTSSPGDTLDVKTKPTPITRFVDYVRDWVAADQTKRWDGLLYRGGAGRGAAVPKWIKSVVLIQGILLKHGIKDYYKKPQMPMTLMLSTSAWAALQELLNAEIENYKGDPMDFNARFKCGDILGPDTGRVMSFFNARAEAVTTEAATVDWSQAGQAFTSKAKRELAQFGCELGKVLRLPKLSDGRIAFAVKGDVFTPWEKALRFLDAQEMVELLCQAYEDLPGLLYRALSESYLEYLPKFVKDTGGEDVERRQIAAKEMPRVTPAAKPVAVQSDDEAVANWGEALEEAESNPMDVILPDAELPGAGTPAAAKPETGAGLSQKTEDEVRQAMQILRDRRAERSQTKA